MYQAEILVKEGPRGAFTFPEGARWQADRFWFSDLYTEAVYSCREDGSDVKTEALVPGTPVGLGWLPDERLLIVAIDDRKVLRRDSHGLLSVHADLGPHLQSDDDVPNDMFVASDGTAYVSTIGFNARGNAPFRRGPLLKVTATGDVIVVSEPLYFPNGITVVDGTTLVVAESWGNRMSAFDIEVDGSLSTRRTWAEFGPIPDTADQAAVFENLSVACDGISGPDVDGAIWVADYVHPRAVRVLPGVGVVDEVRTVGGLHTYSVVLGGADGRTLFLATTDGDTDPVQRREHPAGQIQVARVERPAAYAADFDER